MILVTGATGNVGRELVPLLVAPGHAVRIATRDASKASMFGAGVECVVGELGDLAIAAAALRGATRLFLVQNVGASASAAVLSAARAAGVGRVVFLSSIAAESTAIGAAHRAREREIAASGLAWTALRPGAFASNALMWRETIRAERRVYSATGDGKTAPIAPRDIARVAAHALGEAAGGERVYELTGPEALTVAEQVRALSAALGVEIEHVEQSVEAEMARLAAAGMPSRVIELLAGVWRAIRAGRALACGQTVTAITGAAAQTFAEWCAEHREEFVPASS